MSTTGDEAPPDAAGSRGEAPGRQKSPARASGELAPVALQMEDLCLWVIERVAKFPRDHRFTMGDRLIETCLGVLDDLSEASFVRDKAALLARASRGLTRARTLVRLSHRARLLSEPQRTYFAVASDEIGRRVGGWTRHVRSR